MDMLMIKRAQVELNSVTNAKEVLELRRMELEHEMGRIDKSIEIQDKKILEVQEKLKQMKGE